MGTWTLSGKGFKFNGKLRHISVWDNIGEGGEFRKKINIKDFIEVRCCRVLKDKQELEGKDE